MFKKKAVISVITVSMLAVIILFSKMNLGATTQQSESLKIKHQLEQQDAQILKDKDAAGAKARSNNQSVIKDNQVLPVPEPDDYKIPYKWPKTDDPGGRHGFIRTANTIWYVKGILEPNQEVWDKFAAWSGPDEDGKQVIGTFVENGQAFNGKYDATYTCPDQNIGKIFITDVKGNVLYFKADSGITGNFNLDSHNWIFDK